MRAEGHSGSCRTTGSMAPRANEVAVMQPASAPRPTPGITRPNERARRNLRPPKWRVTTKARDAVGMSRGAWRPRPMAMAPKHFSTSRKLTTYARASRWAHSWNKRRRRTARSAMRPGAAVSSSIAAFASYARSAATACTNRTNVGSKATGLNPPNFIGNMTTQASEVWAGKSTCKIQYRKKGARSSSACCGKSAMSQGPKWSHPTAVRVRNPVAACRTACAEQPSAKAVSSVVGARPPSRQEPGAPPPKKGALCEHARPETEYNHRSAACIRIQSRKPSA